MSSRGNSILVVDGSTQTTDLINHWLRMEDLTIHTAESGLNALAKLDLFDPGIVIANVSLPDISGFDLCKRVKSSEQNPDTLVLLFSTLDSHINRMRAEEMGADDYIETSAEHYLFVSKVRSLLRVNQLSSQLRQKYAELEEKNILLDMQLEMALQIQRALLPEINMEFGGCTLLSRYYPAMGIGGDFYKITPLTEESFSIVMGDISGHGIAAAFLTTILNMMINNLAPVYYEPHRLLYYLNNELCALFEDSEYTYYACVFYAVVNTKDKSVLYANAGQSLPLHVETGGEEGGVTVTELAASGLPVGMMKDSQYDYKSVGYNPSDLLLFHTDGLQDIYYKNQPDDFTRQMKKLLPDIFNIDDLKEILDVVCDNFYHTGMSETKKMEMDDVSMILCRL